MIIKTFGCSLEQHDDILRFEKLKPEPEHGKIKRSIKTSKDYVNTQTCAALDVTVFFLIKTDVNKFCDQRE